VVNHQPHASQRLTSVKILSPWPCCKMIPVLFALAVMINTKGVLQNMQKFWIHVHLLKNNA
jgi:hypothetical protein